MYIRFVHMGEYTIELISEFQGMDDLGIYSYIFMMLSLSFRIDSNGLILIEASLKF